MNAYYFLSFLSSIPLLENDNDQNDETAPRVDQVLEQ